MAPTLLLIGLRHTGAFPILRSPARKGSFVLSSKLPRYRRIQRRPRRHCPGRSLWVALFLTVPLCLLIPCSLVLSPTSLCAAQSEAGSNQTAPSPAVSVTDDDGPYRVRGLRYVGGTTRRISTERLDWVRIRLSRTSQGLVGPTPEHPVEWVELGKLTDKNGLGSQLFASALREIPTAITRAYQRSGLGAVRVVIKQDDLDALREMSSDGVLTVHIVEGVVGAIGVQALVGEDTLDADETLEGAAVHRIGTDSPVQPGDLVEVELLQDYTSALNRFRHRRVELGLRPGDHEGEVQLDYWVTSVRPWTGSLEVDNSGTSETGRFRERASWRHQNFTGRDDALSFGFVTAEFDEANAGFASYELPLRAFPLFSVRLFGVHSQYDASEVGAFDLDFSGESTRAGVEVRSNLYGHRGLFADVIFSGEYQRLETENETVQSRSRASFAIGTFGVELEQRQPERSFTLGVHTDWSLATLEGTDAADVERLGRTNADDDWRRIRLAVTARRPLDSLLHDDEPDTGSTSAFTVTGRLRAQDALGTRTPANFTHLNGGLHTVRGYPEAFASGDRGFTASVELGVHAARLLSPGPPRQWGGRTVRLRPERPGKPADWDVVGRVFLDVGRSSHQSRLSFEQNVTLVSSGVGCDIVIRRNAQLRIDWGIALDRVNNGVEEVDPGDNRWHVSFSVAF